MKYLITGITGFAGPHLAQLLLRHGHEVHGIVRTPNGRQNDLLDIVSPEELSRLNFHHLDLKHFYGINKLLQKEKFDGVFHLAAQSHPPTSFIDPILTFDENVTGSINLITSLEKSNTKFMFCSTSEVYGDSCKHTGVLTTKDPLSPSNPYGASKAAIDLYMQERMRNGFLKGFVTRAFSHTGPRRGFNFSISSDAYQIAKMKLGLQSKTLQVGNLETERVVIDVRDCVNAYYLLMQSDEATGHVFNVCGEDVRKMQHFTDLLIHSAGFAPHEVAQEINPDFYRPIDIDIQIGDCSQLYSLTGWKPKIPIETTISDLLTYWIKKLSTPRT
jgi:GDP-mannose 4,6-dehydratase|tara:strand:- start:319 stop:1308 length:990 start_codon:yes stop_codon:yes gene_type:complete